MKTTVIALVSATLAMATQATEYHVATSGNDSNAGSSSAPLHTIQKAADLAKPGDVITVHAGVYRERVTPPRGGESDVRRIVYQAAAGEKVEIKGSEAIANWARVQDDVWKAIVPNSFFGGFNPYTNLIHGDWFNPKGRQHHTGAVYLNGDWMIEAARLDDVLKSAGPTPLWFGQVDGDRTTIWAQFKEVNPNEQRVEINVRPTVFYPAVTGINFLTVRGFTMRDAATPWAPPTAEQVGVIGTHWSKGWIIESNIISHSICSGIALGKYGDQWDNTSADTAEGYVKTIDRALQNGWDKETIGHHLVRYNTISHCEQTGIVGSLGPIFSVITSNVIHDIHVRCLFTGAEMAGIKLHAAIDVEISHNHIYRTCRGIWLDWMAQGTHVTGNLFHDNTEDLFLEVDHGPFLIDNNLFLSSLSIREWSEGGAYAHNLIAGKIECRPELTRDTPYHPAHATTLAGITNIHGGDNRFYNNILLGNSAPGTDPNSWDKDPQRAVGYGLSGYDSREAVLRVGGNVYYGGAKPYKTDTNSTVSAGLNPSPKIADTDGGTHLVLTLDKSIATPHHPLVTTELLGKAKIPNLPYERPNGAAIKIGTDYFGRPRNEVNPTAGPFENPGLGELKIKVW